MERPEGLTPIDDVDIEWPFGEVGECLVQHPENPILQPVACVDAHDVQRYAVAELDPEWFPTGATFDPIQIEVAVRTHCEVQLGQFIGTASPGAQLDIALTRPSAATFQQGDRRYQCLLGAYGRRLIGDAAHPDT